ncbi:hypothetical protein GCM10027597_10070 [Saccharopolyspora tripterygii]
MAGQARIRTIARELGRSPSTISREIRRNGMPPRGDIRKWAYRPYSAQDRALARRPRPKPRKITTNLQLHPVIQAHLDRKLSPSRSPTNYAGTSLRVRERTGVRVVQPCSASRAVVWCQEWRVCPAPWRRMAVPRGGVAGGVLQWLAARVSPARR